MQVSLSEKKQGGGGGYGGGYGGGGYGGGGGGGYGKPTQHSKLLPSPWSYAGEGKMHHMECNE